MDKDFMLNYYDKMVRPIWTELMKTPRYQRVACEHDKLEREFRRLLDEKLGRKYADHIRFVLDSLAENTAPVRNMKQYLLAMLYNAPTTMNLYYQNKTNHDFARGSPKAG